MSTNSRGKQKDGNMLTSFADHNDFRERVEKSLYYGGKIPDVSRFSLPVTEIASRVFSKVHYKKSLDRLTPQMAAKISDNACISPCSLVIAIMYLERLRKCNAQYVDQTPPSKLFVVSLMIASKFLQDDGEDDQVIMSEWAASCGFLTVSELKTMEREFLKAIQWDVFVYDDIFWTKFKQLEEAVALKQGKMRGNWFTYADLYNLLDHVDYFNLITLVYNVSFVMMSAYVTTVITILASFMIADNLSTQLTCHNASGNSTASTTPFVADSNEPIVNLPNVDVINSTEFETIEEKTKVNATLNILTTSLVLANLKTTPLNSNDSPCSKCQKNNEWIDKVTCNVSNPSNMSIDQCPWKWWNNTTLTWLFESSKDLTSDLQNMSSRLLTIIWERFTCDHDLNLWWLKSSGKFRPLHSHTRLQDQMEGSWHVEWVDMLKMWQKSAGNFLNVPFNTFVFI